MLAIKVIIIDDNEADANLLQRQFKRLSGWEVEVQITDSTDDAQVLIQTRKPDVAFVDYRLSRETGLDLIRRLKPRFPEVQFVLLTGFGSEEVVAEAFRSGVDDYLPKKDRTPEILDKTFRHLNERRNTQQEFLRIETKLNSLLDKTDTGLVTLDSHGLIVYSNEAFVRIFQLPSVEAAFCMFITDYIAPDHRDVFQQKIQACFQGSDMYDFETAIIRPNSSRAYLRVNASIEALPEGVFLNALIQDITPRKKAELALINNEKSLRRAQQIAMLGSWELDLKTGEFNCSDEMGVIFGNAGDFMSTLTGPVFFMDFVVPDYREAVNEHFHRVMGEDVYDQIEFEIFDGKGIRKHLRHEFSLGYDEEGRKKLIGIVQDITRQKRFENELIEAMKRAEASDRMKTAFLSNLSHEIRTPLNAIIGFSNLLTLSGVSAADRDDYIRNINTSGERLLSLFEDMIVLSQLEAEQVPVVFDDCRLNRLLQDVYMWFNDESHIRQHPGLDFRLALQDDTDVRIHTDSRLLFKALCKILDNAFKFTEKGYIECGYTCDSHTVVIYVKDTGIGVPQDFAEVIFERFQKAPTPNGKVYEGAGIGLAIARMFIHLIQGSIRLESNVGTGTVFYVSLPVKNNAKE